MTACGNDPIPTAIDSGPGAVDSSGMVDACVGHACPTNDPGPKITDPEGGNLVVEHMQLDTELAGLLMFPAGVTTMTRIIGFYMSAQTPDDNPFPTPGQCTNLATTKSWPLNIGMPHTDVDVGTLKIKGKNKAGTDVTIDIPKSTAAGRDYIGRPHDVFYEYIQPNTDDTLKSDSFYTVEFGGVTGGMPATTFNDALYLSADYPSVQNPGLEENGPLIAGTDFPVAWTPPTPVNAPPATQLVGGGLVGATWLVDIMGSPTHVCTVPAGAGHFTIPGSAITEFKAVAVARGLPPTKMIMLRNVLAHQLARLPPNDPKNLRRIDMVTLACWAQVMDVQ